MAFIETVNQYTPFLYPNQGKRSGRINLYCNTSKLYLIFADPSVPMSPNSYSPDTKIGVAYQPFEQYQHYLDLLRNEGPISITFRPEDSPPSFVVYSGSEPPGEGES
ncbi:MAG: hypothetical protein AB1589_05530 [Cyanobacteriota bacterium]